MALVGAPGARVPTVARNHFLVEWCMAIALRARPAAVLPPSLATIEAACRTLAEARTLDDVRDIRDMAEAARICARLARLGLEAQNHAAEIKVRAEHRAGELLAQIVTRDGGGRPKTGSTMRPVLRLEDLGVNKTQSSRWQLLAQLPLPELDQHL